MYRKDIITWIVIFAVCGGLLFWLSGCATVPPEPTVRTVTVNKEVPVPCPALARLGAEPQYPDTDVAILGAKNIAERARLYVKGRLMRTQRLAEYSVARVSCTF